MMKCKCNKENSIEYACKHGNLMMGMVSGKWRMMPKQFEICVLIIVRTSNGLLRQFKYIVTENVTKMKLGSVADTQANILLWIETLLLFDRTENNIANFQYKVRPHNDFATDGLRFAVCNDDVGGVDGSLQPIQMY